MESPESSPEMDRKEEAGVSKEADLGYQVFQKPGSPGSHSHRTLDSGVQQDTATLNSNTSAYDGDGSNSYYSDRYTSCVPLDRGLTYCMTFSNILVPRQSSSH